MKPESISQEEQIAEQRKTTDTQYIKRARIHNMVKESSIVRKIMAIVGQHDTPTAEDLMMEDANALNNLINYEYTQLQGIQSYTQVVEDILNGETFTYINALGTNDIPSRYYMSAERGRALAHKFTEEVQQKGITEPAKKYNYKKYKELAINVNTQNPKIQNHLEEKGPEFIVKNITFLQIANEFLIRHIKKVVQEKDTKEFAALVQAGVLQYDEGIDDLRYFYHHCAKEIQQACYDEDSLIILRRVFSKL